MDLFLGNYIVEENEGVVRPSPLQSERDWKFYAVRFYINFYLKKYKCYKAVVDFKYIWGNERHIFESLPTFFTKLSLYLGFLQNS